MPFEEEPFPDERSRDQEREDAIYRRQPDEDYLPANDR